MPAVGAPDTTSRTGRWASEPLEHHFGFKNPRSLVQHLVRIINLIETIPDEQAVNAVGGEAATAHLPERTFQPWDRAKPLESSPISTQ
jgi:hypothetical protein